MALDWNVLLLALGWGLLSAVSLPAGALLGLWSQPKGRVVSALMAFGGGALLFALTIELFGHALHAASDHHANIESPGLVLVTMLAAVVGGVLFQGLNRLLEDRGGFLRKRSLIGKHVVKEKREQAQVLLNSLSKVQLLQALPPEEVIQLIPAVRKVRFEAGQAIFEEGSAAERLYFIESGQVSIVRGSGSPGGIKAIAVLGPKEVFGEIGLISDAPRTATASAVTDVSTWMIPKSAFDEALQQSPALQKATHALVDERIEELSELQAASPAEAAEWGRRAHRTLEHLSLHMNEEDFKRQVEEYGERGGAALAIWLGIGLDAIPESLVIGMLVVTAAAERASISLAFIMGVFLANLPEAMSSAVTMRRSGMKVRKILLMWISLCVLTGIGAMLGAMIFPPHPEGWLVYFVFGIEGLAAGAMLTMIAETMLPEAYEQGGSGITGLSTLAGFLATLAVKLIP
jgi:CRP-like cAMP-binding protein